MLRLLLLLLLLSLLSIRSHRSWESSSLFDLAIIATSITIVYLGQLRASKESIGRIESRWLRIPLQRRHGLCILSNLPLCHSRSFETYHSPSHRVRDIEHLSHARLVRLRGRACSDLASSAAGSMSLSESCSSPVSSRLETGEVSSGCPIAVLGGGRSTAA